MGEVLGPNERESSRRSKGVSWREVGIVRKTCDLLV